MGSTMMEEEQQHQPLTEEPGTGLQLAIATTFSVAQTPGADDFVIKQEPQDLLPEMIAQEVMDEQESDQHQLFAEDAIESDLQVFPEVSDVILQRAVSPPTYADPSEQRLEELILFYKKKYQLKDVTVELECCDKIWETLQLIKNIQGCTSEEYEPCQFTSPKNLSESQPKLPGPLIPYQPILGNNNKALPDFRFSVKSKKKLYHCITCGKEFIDSQHLRQHAIDEHGVYVNPKRVYKPRGDSSPKSTQVVPEINKNQLPEKMETEVIEPIISPVIQPVHTIEAAQVSEIENIEKPLISDTKIEEPQVKSNMKEKIRCILCKRICTDIVYHMKGYHKVGCISSIIAQCETIPPDNIVETEKSNIVTPQINEIDMNETLAVAVKKRKRNTPRWTIQKKKHKVAVADTTSNLPISSGPFKCNVCLGYYKTAKSFGYHRRLHKVRGETPENFDPSKCRFLNSPLCMTKASSTTDETVNNYIPVEKEAIKSQTAVTNYFTVQTESVKPQKENGDSPIPEDLNMETGNGRRSERTSCHCGRSFRNYHTMYLHKVKCKGTNGKNDKLHSQNTNDADSGIGISIKIKKNKNDSYEVVPRSTPIEDSYKDSRSSKDSDASSNDSGMVSIDYNNQKADSSELSKYSKGHSILRIQVAEDDEEVDIEDGDSDHSNLNEDNDVVSGTNRQHNISETISPDSTENKTVVQNAICTVGSESKRSNIVPSLTNLCKQVLSKTKQQVGQMSTYRCQTCSTYFRNKKELMDHALKMKHSVKSHCPCGKKFKNLKFFNIHVRRYHPLLLKCSYCMTNFDRIEKYTEHKCSVTEGQLFIEPILQTECMQCKILVDLGEPFDKHMKTHNTDGTNLYQCFKCELKFDNAHQRRSHFSKEHGFSLCRICGKVLHVDYLSKHEAYHDGLGHPCHLCKKAFSQKTLFRKHVQTTHDPLINETVKCIVCSKIMKLRYLRKHMSFHLHTEICRKCNKCYRSDEQKNLEDHIALDHPNDYPTLKCDICNTSFLSEKRYEEHCEEGSCKSDANNTSSLVQNTVTNS